VVEALVLKAMTVRRCCGYHHLGAVEDGGRDGRSWLRSPGERANAQLKSWRILRKLRCCPWRAGQLAKAIHVLQAREIGG
jgi:hypothetical protein